MLRYEKGDVIKAAQEELKNSEHPLVIIIPHICNDIGGWGRGFVMSLSKTWKEPEQAYRSLKQWDLGVNQMVHIPQDKMLNELIVVNMIAQRGIDPNKNGVPPIRYQALDKCLSGVEQMISRSKRSPWFEKRVRIFAPKFGAGLAGGDWEKIEKQIKERWRNLDVTIFEYEKATK